MNQRIHLLLISLLTIFLAACSTADKKVEKLDPNAWITAPPQKQGMRFGVGSAQIVVSEEKALKRARDIALADIAQQIEVTIQASTSSRVQESVKDEQSELVSHYSQAIDTRIPEFTFSHYQQEASYHDKGKNIVYVLMSLNITKELADLRKKISQLDQQITEAEMDVEAQTGFSGLQASASQLKNLSKRQLLQRNYNRLAGDTSRSELTIYQRQQKKQLLQRLASTPIGVVSKKLEAKPLVTQLVSVLTEKGLAVSMTDHETFFIEVDVTESTKEEKGVYYHFVDGSYSIINEVGSILDEKSATAKGSSATENMARTRAIKKLADRLAEGLTAIILGE